MAVLMSLVFDSAKHCLVTLRCPPNLVETHVSHALRRELRGNQ